MEIQHKKEWHFKSVLENMDLLINGGVIWEKVKIAFISITVERKPHESEIQM